MVLLHQEEEYILLVDYKKVIAMEADLREEDITILLPL